MSLTLSIGNIQDLIDFQYFVRVISRNLAIIFEFQGISIFYHEISDKIVKIQWKNIEHLNKLISKCWMNIYPVNFKHPLKSIDFKSIPLND